MKKLFTPGPGNIPQFVRVQLSKDIIHHRKPEYKKILYNNTEKLKKVFKTESDVLILTASGTGAMESAVVNLLSYGDEVLVINTGYFGDRFREICETYQLTVRELAYEWGETYKLDDVKVILEKYPDIKAVFVTFQETASGVLNDLRPLGEITNDTNRLLIADCISGMVIHDFEFDNWHVDCAVASSQKGFLLPPGLAFVALSNKAKEALKHSNLPSFYFDYNKYISAYSKGQNPYTPSISLVLALNVVLDYIIEKGPALIEEKTELRKYLEAKLVELGFELFIKDENIRGNALVPVYYDQDKIKEFVDFLDCKNITVSKGQGKLQDQMLRFGLISEFTTEDIDELIDVIKEFQDLE